MLQQPSSLRSHTPVGGIEQRAPFFEFVRDGIDDGLMVVLLLSPWSGPRCRR